MKNSIGGLLVATSFIFIIISAVSNYSPNKDDVIITEIETKREFTVKEEMAALKLICEDEAYAVKGNYPDSREFKKHKFDCINNLSLTLKPEQIIGGARLVEQYREKNPNWRESLSKPLAN